MKRSRIFNIEFVGGMGRCDLIFRNSGHLVLQGVVGGIACLVLDHVFSSNISWALESWVLDTRGFYFLLTLIYFNEKLIYFNGFQFFLVENVFWRVGSGSPQVEGVESEPWEARRGPRRAKQGPTRTKNWPKFIKQKTI